jgi:hypothetical protein
MDDQTESKPTGQMIQVDEARIRDQLGEMVRGTVEEALNAMPDLLNRVLRYRAAGTRS